MGTAAEGSREGHADSGTEPSLGAYQQRPTTGEGAHGSGRPELLVGAAFVGGLVAARVLKLVRR